LTVEQIEPANPRDQQAAATRRQLLDAAREAFETRGYRATTVGAITAGASTAHGTFYLYFHNKEDAFCQVVEAVIVEEMAVGTAVPVDHDHRAAVEQGIRNFLSVYRRHGGLWRALLEGMLQSPRVRDLWLDLRRRWVVRLSAALEAGQRAGTARPLDPLMVAHVLTAMTEWSAFTHLVLDEPVPVGEDGIEPLVATLTDLWHRSIVGAVPEDAAAGGPTLPAPQNRPSA
jgi:AcrR family transcriptional regulator